MAVEVSVREICGELEITALEPGSGSISFQTPEISRPGLQFTGFYEKFSPKRVQLIGNAEMYYLYSLTPEQLADRMERVIHGASCSMHSLRPRQQAPGDTA